MSPRSAAPQAAQSYSSRVGVHRKTGEAAELRKTLKPLMEKRRRARINESLNQLKTLILPLIGKDSSRYSKLEKADILEMTVQFLREIPAPGESVPDPAESYQEGYRACLSHLTSLLAKSHLLGRDSCSHLLEHLQRTSTEPSSCQDCSSPTDSCSAWRRAVPASPARGLREVSPPHPQAANPGIWRPW
ncbi:transcription factor HES-2 [Chelonoidis abingdonii]|uniref:transcription factor HES-2 n=1 Tax=Chelonoidis abingdonii TaxID=106734 RepID=UPI0013F244C2|nr:transcription factor HES-2 [Chelonoidis abingdonii]